MVRKKRNIDDNIYNNDDNENKEKDYDIVKTQQRENNNNFCNQHQMIRSEIDYSLEPTHPADSTRNFEIRVYSTNVFKLSQHHKFDESHPSG